MNWHIFQIAEVTGSSELLFYHSGEEVNRSVIDLIKEDQGVEISMKGIINITSAFTNGLVINLRRELQDLFYTHIKFIDTDHINLWQFRYDNALELAENPELAARYDELLNNLFED